MSAILDERKLSQDLQNTNGSESPEQSIPVSLPLKTISSISSSEHSKVDSAEENPLSAAAAVAGPPKEKLIEDKKQDSVQIAEEFQK